MVHSLCVNLDGQRRRRVLSTRTAAIGVQMTPARPDQPFSAKARPATRPLAALLSVLGLAACATPAERLDAVASGLGFSRQTALGENFTHVLYQNRSSRSDGLLHVYLDGDGAPWATPSRIAADPTPRNPLTLRLMAQDPAPSLYLGRPCYLGQARAPACDPSLWTSRRYSAQVVDSMAAALRRRLATTRYSGLLFIGYSGGGVLAMLLAERFPQTQGVLTVAANLDIERWTIWRGYSPLTGSLNPASRSPLAPAIVQLHWFGGRDRNVPVELARAAVSRQPCAELRQIASFDHSCCWADVWPDILSQWRALADRRSASPACVE